MYDFVRGFTAEGVTNWSGAAKISDFSLNAVSFLRYCEMCGLYTP